MMELSAPLNFVKMSGTGNDFIIIDHREEVISPEQMPEFVRLVCRRKFSVGADGLIFIENSENVDFRWRFFNGDGSVAEMCGNGARCAARYAFMHGIAPARMRFETIAGIIEAEVDGSEVSLRMTSPKDTELDRTLEVAEREIVVHSIDTGVPHAVCFVDDIRQVDVRGIGRAIRFHEAFKPAGTNVNFVMKESGNTYFVRTYERGVEDETFACGTGAVASALIAALSGEASSPVEIITSGSDRLAISFELQEQGCIDNVFLRGPALVVYRGELNVEALLG